jgi:hypothetical protein
VQDTAAGTVSGILRNAGIDGEELQRRSGADTGRSPNIPCPSAQPAAAVKGRSPDPERSERVDSRPAAELRPGETNGPRVPTLVIELTVEPTTWLVVTRA